MIHVVGKPAAISQDLKQLGNCARSGYIYAELTVSSPNGSRGHRKYSLCLPMEGGQAELAWVAGLNTKMVYA